MVFQSECKRANAIARVQPNFGSGTSEGDLLKAHPRLKVERLRAALLYSAALIDLETTMTA